MKKILIFFGLVALASSFPSISGGLIKHSVSRPRRQESSTTEELVLAPIDFDTNEFLINQDERGDQTLSSFDAATSLSSSELNVESNTQATLAEQDNSIPCIPDDTLTETQMCHEEMVESCEEVVEEEECHDECSEPQKPECVNQEVEKCEEVLVEDCVEEKEPIVQVVAKNICVDLPRKECDEKSKICHEVPHKICTVVNKVETTFEISQKCSKKPNRVCKNEVEKVCEDQNILLGPINCERKCLPPKTTKKCSTKPEQVCIEKQRASFATPQDCKFNPRSISILN